MDELRIALAGVGGYGAAHVAAAEALTREGLVRTVAFAETNGALPAVARLVQTGARHYEDYALMLEREDLDLVCIATPIPHHAPMAEAALRRGLNVFLEKPPAVRIQDLVRLVELEESNDCFCEVGFQDMARPEVLALKHALCEGAVGPVRAIRAEARWTRSTAYFSRAPWAGKVRLGDAWVLDGPMNNALAHVLNMAAFLAHPEPHEFAVPTRVRAELYRANDIEGEDTDCLRAEMDTGVEVCIHLTLASESRENRPRSWTVIGEDGTARYHDIDGVELPGRHIPASSEEPPLTTQLRRLVEVVLESDEPLLMPLAETAGFVLLSNGAYESSGRIHDIPDEYVRTEQEPEARKVVPGLDEIIQAAAAEGRLLSEMDVPWAVATEPFDLAGYDAFPRRWRP